MATKYSEKELLALHQKEADPDCKVLCPRCGNELIFRDFKCAYQVKCQTENCLEMNVRGI